MSKFIASCRNGYVKIIDFLVFSLIFKAVEVFIRPATEDQDETKRTGVDHSSYESLHYFLYF